MQTRLGLTTRSFLFLFDKPRLQLQKDVVQVLVTSSRYGEGMEHLNLVEVGVSTGAFVLALPPTVLSKTTAGNFTGTLNTFRSSTLGLADDGVVNVLEGDTLNVTSCLVHLMCC